MFTISLVGTKQTCPLNFFFVALLDDVNALPMAVIDGTNKNKKIKGIREKDYKKIK